MESRVKTNRDNPLWSSDDNLKVCLNCFHLKSSVSQSTAGTTMQTMVVKRCLLEQTLWMESLFSACYPSPECLPPRQSHLVRFVFLLKRSIWMAFPDWHFQGDSATHFLSVTVECAQMCIDTRYNPPLLLLSPLPPNTEVWIVWSQHLYKTKWISKLSLALV